MKSRAIHFVNFALGIGLVWPASSFAQAVVATAPTQACTTAHIAPNGTNTCPAAQALNSAPPPADPNAPVTAKFGGLTFGVGLGLNFNAQKSAVSSASVINGIVRVSGVDDTTASIVLESHYFFVPSSPFFTVPAGAWGHGPFVGIVANVAGTNSNSFVDH
jgi:hypothetical protein